MLLTAYLAKPIQTKESRPLKGMPAPASYAHNAAPKNSGVMACVMKCSVLKFNDGSAETAD